MNLEDKTLEELDAITDANKNNNELICTYAWCADDSHARKIKFMCLDANCQRNRPLGQYGNGMSKQEIESFLIIRLANYYIGLIV